MSNQIPSSAGGPAENSPRYSPNRRQKGSGSKRKPKKSEYDVQPAETSEHHKQIIQLARATEALSTGFREASLARLAELAYEAPRVKSPIKKWIVNKIDDYCECGGLELRTHEEEYSLDTSRMLHIERYRTTNKKYIINTI